METRLYDTATSLGITVITVSQRPALVAYHALVSVCLLLHYVHFHRPQLGLFLLPGVVSWLSRDHW